MALASGASAQHQDPRGGVQTELIVTEHVWENDVLQYAPGDPITQEEADRLGVTPEKIAGEVDRRVAIANANARIQAEEREKDMKSAGLDNSAFEKLDVPRPDTVNRDAFEDKALRGPKEAQKEGSVALTPGGARIHPEQDLPNPALEGDSRLEGASEGSSDLDSMTVAELDEKYGDADGYPKSGSKSEKVEFAKGQ